MEIETQIQIRLDICVPAAVTALITAISRMISLYHPSKNPLFFEQLLNCGLLAQFESLLSTRGSELGMLNDMNTAVTILGHFHLQFVEQNYIQTFNPSISVLKNYIAPQRDYDFSCFGFGDYLISWQVPFFSELPESLKRRALVDIKPIIFTQGINEKQSVAIKLGETKLQEIINKENFILLEEYYASWSRFYKDNPGQDIRFDDLEKQLKEVCKTIQYSSDRFIC